MECVLADENKRNLYGDENELVWLKFNSAMASFCGNKIKSTNQTDKLVCCIVGEGMFHITSNLLTHSLTQSLTLPCLYRR